MDCIQGFENSDCSKSQLLEFFAAFVQIFTMDSSDINDVHDGIIETVGVMLSTVEELENETKKENFLQYVLSEEFENLVFNEINKKNLD